MRDFLWILLAVLIFFGIPLAVGGILGSILPPHVLGWITGALIIAGTICILFAWNRNDGSSHNLGIVGLFGGLPTLCIISMWVAVLLQKLPWKLVFSISVK